MERQLLSFKTPASFFQKEGACELEIRSYIEQIVASIDLEKILLEYIIYGNLYYIEEK